MPLLLLKLTLTPLLVGGASIAARRWGPAIGGWIVSLPLTSGPILFFLALDDGPAFAARAAVGTLLGLGAIVAYSVAWTVASPPRAVDRAGGGLGRVRRGGTSLSQQIAGLPFTLLVALVVAAIVAAPAGRRPPGVARNVAPHPAWDLPARVVVGTSLVVGLTAAAPLLGPMTSGLVVHVPRVRVGPGGVRAAARRAPAARGRPPRPAVGLFGTVAFYVVRPRCWSSRQGSPSRSWRRSP